MEMVFEDTVECFVGCPETKCMIYLKCSCLRLCDRVELSSCVELEGARWDGKFMG